MKVLPSHGGEATAGGFRPLAEEREPPESAARVGTIGLPPDKADRPTRERSSMKNVNPNHRASRRLEGVFSTCSSQKFFL